MGYLKQPNLTSDLLCCSGLVVIRMHGIAIPLLYVYAYSPGVMQPILINWGEKQNLGLVLQQGNNVHVQPIESFSVTNIHPHTGRRQTRRNICVSNPCTEEAFGHIHTQEAFVLPTNKNKLLYYQHYVALVTVVSL